MTFTTVDALVTEDAILAVKKGAYWLDQAYPEWESKIDPGSLKMQDGNHCVLGQVVGKVPESQFTGFGSMVLFLFGTLASSQSMNWVSEHGFDASSNIQQAWLDLFKERGILPVPY